MHKRLASAISLCIFLLSFAFPALPVNAVVTIVVPDDYPIIQQAINAANAGDTIYVKKGVYEGTANQTLAINKAITLIGEDKSSTILKLNPPSVKKNIITFE